MQRSVVSLIVDMCLTIAEHNIDPPTLAMIGMILYRNHVQPLKRMGSNMLLCAAVLGNINSIVVVLSKALQRDEIHHPALLIPMTKLQFYANQGNVEAMVMYGRILDHQKKHSEAAELFRRVAETPRDVSIDADIGNSLVYQGDICLRQGMKEEARAHFEKAALEFDNPRGYYKLALLMPDEDSLKEPYMLKAAASGIGGAVVEVAGLYAKAADLDASSEKGQHAKNTRRENGLNCRHSRIANQVRWARRIRLDVVI